MCGCAPRCHEYAGQAGALRIRVFHTKQCRSQPSPATSPKLHPASSPHPTGCTAQLEWPAAVCASTTLSLSSCHKTRASAPHPPFGGGMAWRAASRVGGVSSCRHELMSAPSSRPAWRVRRSGPRACACDRDTFHPLLAACCWLLASGTPSSQQTPDAPPLRPALRSRPSLGPRPSHGRAVSRSGQEPICKPSAAGPVCLCSEYIAYLQEMWWQVPCHLDGGAGVPKGLAAWHAARGTQASSSPGCGSGV